MMSKNLLYKADKLINELPQGLFNMAAHMYDEDKVDEMLLLIRDSFIAAFVVLEKELRDKINEL